jgi:hypothetical protein
MILNSSKNSADGTNLPRIADFRRKLSQRSSHMYTSTKSLISPSNTSENIEEKFKAKVAGIRDQKALIRKSYREKFERVSANATSCPPIDTSSINCSREKSNAVARMLLSNSAFSKTYLKVNDSIHQTTKSSVSGSSLFYEDDDKEEFPKRNHLCWNDDLVMKQDSLTSHIEDYVNDQKSEVGYSFGDQTGDLHRSMYSDGRDLEPISEEVKQKYFGRLAKQHFYHTYQEINQMSHLVVGGLDGVQAMMNRRVNDKPNVTNNQSVATSRKASLQEFGESALDTSSTVSWGVPLVEDQLGPISLQHPDVSDTSTQPDQQENRNQSHASADVALVSPSDDKLFTFCEDDVYDLYKSSYNSKSPRASFLIGCLRQNLPPRALAMLRNHLTTKLDLSHLGLGDNLIELLAQALVDLPMLEVIILKDNNLSDHGLETIINSINLHNKILELDLSSNKIGHRAANSLGRFMSKPECPLIGLCVSADNVEDSVCSLFVNSLMNNKVLRVSEYLMIL